MMIDPGDEDKIFFNHSKQYFSSLQSQEADPDRFTAIRQNVIRFVEKIPQKSCDQGWTYDHSMVFSTITSEVPLIQILPHIHYLNIAKSLL